MAGADGVGVVVVVPSLAAGEEGDPPGVARVVVGVEAAGAEEVGGGVDQPGGVQADGDAQEGPPEEHGDGPIEGVAGGGEGRADGKLRDAGEDEREPVEAAEQDVAAVAGEVGGVAAQQSGLGVEGAAGDDPTGVRPPGAFAGSVWVALVVGVLMVDAMGGDPEDGASLEGHGPAGGDEVFEPLGNAVAAMGEQAMVGHADADVDGEEVHDGEGGEVLPGEAEEGGDGPNVEEDHDGGGDPVDAALLVGAAHAQVLLDLAGCLQTTGVGGAVSGGDAAGCGDALGKAGRGDRHGARGSLRAGLGGGRFGDEKGW